MGMLTSIAGRVASGAVVLAALAGGIAWWQADPQARHAAASIAGRLLGWGVGVLALPWLLFSIITWAARQNSNLAGALLVAGLTLLELGVLATVTHLANRGITAWTLAAAAGLMAGVYNLLTCDWIAERFD